MLTDFKTQHNNAVNSSQIHLRVSVSQSCPSLCNPMNYSPPGSCVHEIFQARILEWVAISFSRGSSQPKDRTRVSCTAGRFFTDWATREAWHITSVYLWYPVQHYEPANREKHKIVCLATMSPDCRVILKLSFSSMRWLVCHGKHSGWLMGTISQKPCQHHRT